MTMLRRYIGKPQFGIAFWISCCALVYAGLAGLKTVVDFDLGWQMATARYIGQHGVIPSTEVFSYTAHGASWIYPVFSGAVFLASYKLGGYVLISWLCALSCVSAVAALCVGRNAWTAALTLLSVPVIAEQTMPRSGMFTVLLFALFARVILVHFERGQGPLWLLPIFMALWVNLHLGFIAGIALMTAYLISDLVEFPFGAKRRVAALERIRRAWPWLVATVAATLINPWGWNIYRAVLQQEFVSKTEQMFVQEFRPLGAFTRWWEWRNPENTVYWMIALASLAAVLALWRRRLGPALILLAAIGAVLGHARISGPFAAVAALFGGAELTSSLRAPNKALSMAGIGVLIILAVVRCSDLVTNRFYIADGQLTLLGAGPVWWLPTRATQFVRNKNLPHELFSTFNLSSYLVWKLGEIYPDFADGRYIPFGDELFYEQRALAREPLDSPLWEEIARRRNIQTVIFPLAPLLALGDFPLKQDCESTRWAPVYMDKAAIVFVRGDVLRNIPRRGCATDDEEIASGSRAERYQQLLNAAGVNYLLGHLPAARALAARAEELTTYDGGLSLLKAEIALASGDREEAEREFRSSVAKSPGDAAWYGLGFLYMNEQRYDEALTAFERSVQIAGLERYQRLYALGKAYAIARQPDKALRTLNEASQLSPFGKLRSAEAAEFLAGIAEAKAAAYTEKGDATAAIAEQRQAVDATPNNAPRWRMLAETYSAFGMMNEARAAEQRAQALTTRTKK